MIRPDAAGRRRQKGVPGTRGSTGHGFWVFEMKREDVAPGRGVINRNLTCQTCIGKKPLCLARFQAHPQVPVGRCPPNLSLGRIPGRVGRPVRFGLKFRMGLPPKRVPPLGQRATLTRLFYSQLPAGSCMKCRTACMITTFSQVQSANRVRRVVLPVEEPFLGGREQV